MLATIRPGTTTYYHPDHLSTRAQTDATGATVRNSGNLPFGDTWYVSGNSTKWKFTTYERDAESGSVIDYAQFRYYHSTQGRFMSADLMGGDIRNPQSLNRYAYVGNDPVNCTDPSGLFWFVNKYCVSSAGGPDNCQYEVVWVDTGEGSSLGGGGGGLGGGGDFGGGGGSVSPFDKLPAAVNLALNALKSLDCAKAVGEGFEDFNFLVTASDLLQNLADNVQEVNDHSSDNAHLGKITFDALDSPKGYTVSAETGGVSYGGPGRFVDKHVTITINTAKGSFVTGTLQSQAVTLLHELGHAISYLFGTSASQIKKDNSETQAGRDQSAANTKLIEEKCFPKKK